VPPAAPTSTHSPLIRTISVLNKRAGITTSQLYALRTGDQVGCLGPLGVVHELAGAVLFARERIAEFDHGVPFSRLRADKAELDQWR